MHCPPSSVLRNCSRKCSLVVAQYTIPVDAKTSGNFHWRCCRFNVRTYRISRAAMDGGPEQR